MNISNTQSIIDNLKNGNKPIDYHFNMNKTPKSIMLTGANGFLSTYLLKEICNLPNVQLVYCLVRDINSIQYQHSKIKIVLYSGMKSFDLDNHDIDEYLKNTDCFIHCAASVNNIKSFDSLYSSNVEFSYFILNKIKNMNLSLSFHLISTLSVYASSSHNVSQYEDKSITLETPKNTLLLPDSQYNIIGGYAQTKWLTEYIFSKTNAHIIRLGLLTPSYQEPKLNQNEFLTKLINLFIKTKSIPFENYETYKLLSTRTLVDITPVDFAAQFISELISTKHHFHQQKVSTPFISHFANHSPLSLFQMINIIQDVKNINFLNCRKEDWQKQLEHLQLGTIEKILLTNTFFRTELKKDNYKYFNIDLFQTSLYNWIPHCKSKDIPTSERIFHKYMEFLNV